MVDPGIKHEVELFSSFIFLIPTSWTVASSEPYNLRFGIWAKHSSRLTTFECFLTLFCMRDCMRSFRACFWIRVRCEPQTDPTLSTVYQCRYEYEDNERKKLIISSTHLRTCVCYNQSREGFLCFRWISFGERAPPIINEEELFSLLASWELAIIFSYLHSECLFQVSLSRIEVNVVSPTFFCKVR